MNIEAIEQEIVDHLQAVFTESATVYKALVMPDSVIDYAKAVPTAVAYVVYTGSTSPGVRNTNPITQDRKPQFSVECLGRSRRGEGGLLILMDLVEKALIGFRPSSCDRMYLVKDDADRGTDGLWVHVYGFECKAMLVQDSLSEPIVVPALSDLKVKFLNGANADDDSNGESTTIIPTEQ